LVWEDLRYDQTFSFFFFGGEWGFILVVFP
jgi:hypothetical protein